MHHPDCNAFDDNHDGLCSTTNEKGETVVHFLPEDAHEGSGSGKYANPGTTDWTGEGRPDFERR